jgi:hypothetical protein
MIRVIVSMFKKTKGELQNTMAQCNALFLKIIREKNTLRRYYLLEFWLRVEGLNRERCLWRTKYPFNGEDISFL